MFVANIQEMSVVRDFASIMFKNHSFPSKLSSDTKIIIFRLYSILRFISGTYPRDCNTKDMFFRPVFSLHCITNFVVRHICLCYPSWGQIAMSGTSNKLIWWPMQSNGNLYTCTGCRILLIHGPKYFWCSTATWSNV